MKPGALPHRVLEHLRANGPDYPAHIARILASNDAAVAGALTNLKRRELIHVHDRRAAPVQGNHRVYYAAGAITSRGRVTELVADITSLVAPGHTIDWLRVDAAAAQISSIANHRRRTAQ